VPPGRKIFPDSQDTTPGIGLLTPNRIACFRWNRVEVGRGQAYRIVKSVDRLHVLREIEYSRRLRAKVFGDLSSDPGGIGFHVVPSAQQRGVCPWGESASEAGVNFGA